MSDAEKLVELEKRVAELERAFAGVPQMVSEMSAAIDRTNALATWFETILADVKKLMGGRHGRNR